MIKYLQKIVWISDSIGFNKEKKNDGELIWKKKWDNSIN